MPEFDDNLIKNLFHMGERAPVDYENPVPAITNLEQLASSEVSQQFEVLVRKVIEKDDQEVALLGRRVLEDMLLPKYPELQNVVPDAYARYQKLIVLFKFINIAVRGLPEISSLIEEHLISVLRAGVDVKKKFQEVLDVYEDVLMGGRIAETLANALSASTEKLGTNRLALKGEDRSMQPSLGNWLLDYRKSTLGPVGSEHRADSYNRVTYITQSPNSRQLSKEEQEVLLRILELYDWLRFGPGPSIPEPTAPTYMRKERITVPLPPKAPPRTEELKTPLPTSPLVRREEAKQTPAPPSQAKVLPPAPRPPVSPVVRRPEPVMRPEPPKTPLPASPLARREGGQPPIVSRQPASPALSANRPAGGSSNEALYRSTLQELQKMREEEAKLAAARTAQTAKSKPPVSAPASAARPVVSPAQPLKAGPAEPFSVNEAIIHAGGQQIPLTGPPPSSEEGQVVAGEEQDLDKKLKDLEEKLE